MGSQKAEGRRQRWVTRLLPSALCLLPFAARASQLTLDKRVVALDDAVTITITLDDAFAGAEVPRLPLANLVIDGGPSVANSFEWINGQSMRRRVLRWSAHPLAPGSALVGPVVVDVTMSGRANLRAVPPPTFAKTIEGSVQIVEGKLSVDRTREDATMTRRWRYLLFPAARGMFASVPGRVPPNLSGAGRRLVTQLRRQVGSEIELYAPYAGQAAAVLLDAIARGKNRSGVIAAIFKTRIRNGITGSFSILPSGDPSVGPITVSVAKKSFLPIRELHPGQRLVSAARHG